MSSLCNCVESRHQLIIYVTVYTYINIVRHFNTYLCLFLYNSTHLILIAVVNLLLYLQETNKRILANACFIFY